MEVFYLLLHPRPAYVIGSGKRGMKVNFMAASWVTPISEEPPEVAVAIGSESYTRTLIDKYGSYTVNVFPVERLRELYFLGSSSGRDVDKVKEIGIEVKYCEETEAPVVGDSLAYLECRVVDTHETEDVVLYIGRVLSMWYDSRYFNRRRGWLFDKINLPLHNWGRGFYEVGRFKLVSSE